MLKIVENPLLNILFFFIILIIAFVIIIYTISRILKILPFLKITSNLILKYIYLLLMPFPVFYLLYYYHYYDPDNTDTYIFNSVDNIKYLKDISIYFFSAGIFGATLKFLNSFVYFKQNFDRVIMSETFDKLLTDKLNILTFSDEHLSNLNNIHDVWKNFTLFKYKQKFPELMNKLHSKIENELFGELTSYYKNFKLQINIEMKNEDENLIKIIEITSFTVIPKSRENIPMEFWVSSNSEENNSSKFIPEETTINGINFAEVIKIEELENDEITINNEKIKHYKFNLEGSSEYHIERVIEMEQTLDTDRLYSFSSAKIIDDISLHIQYCDKLNVFFANSGKNIFRKDNHKLNGQSYINRDVLLPGEIFNVFIFKK